jgi:aerobic-type carbon monoxide dehydrogenase small subunit (CoxS/CutS family)
MPAFVLSINGSKRPVDAPGEESLLSVLRNRLDLTGTKYGCGEGQCGACAVLMDGRAVRSCKTAVREAAGKRIITIEGLARAGRLHPVQAAFLEAEAFQCGFCTPGMIISAVGLLEKNANPTDEEITGGLAGNICR